MFTQREPMKGKAIDLDDQLICKRVEGWHLEPKLDGIRALFIIENGKITPTSRSGKPMYNLDYVISALRLLRIDNAVFDGELYAGDWNRTISIVHRQKKHPMAHELHFHVFDCVTLQDWNSGKTPEFSIRRDMLERIFKDRNNSHIKLVPSLPLPKGGKDAILQQMDSLVAQGFEGGMLKNPTSKYEFKRSSSWLKVKPITEADLKIVGFNVGFGKCAGTLGALVVAGVVEWRGKTYKIRSEVGTGFTDEMRKHIWNRRTRLIDSIAEIKFQEVADTNMSGRDDGTHALRFAAFVRLRPDKRSTL